MSIQGSVNSVFASVLGVSVAGALKYKEKKEEKAKVEGQYVTDLNKRILENKAARKKEMDRIAQEQVRKAQQHEQQQENLKKHNEELNYRKNLLNSLNNISSNLQNFNPQSINQSLAQKGVQQIEQKNALQQRFEQVNMFDKIDKQKQLKMNIGE